jgi:hypothetical protein
MAKNTARGIEWADDKNYNPNDFEVGGQAGGADARRAEYDRKGRVASGRDAVQIDTSQSDASRAGQAAAGDMMRDAATGRVSVAQQQADRQMKQAAQAQAAQAASARGTAGLAMAGRQAAAGTANAQQNIAGQAQINATQERLAAQQAYAQQQAQQRGQDMQGAQAQAGMTMGQRQLNQQGQLAYDAMGQQTDAMQMQGGQARQGTLSQSAQAAQSLNAGINENNTKRQAETEGKFIDAGIEAGKSVLGALALSDANAKTGIVPILSDVRAKMSPGSSRMFEDSYVGESDWAGAKDKPKAAEPDGLAKFMSGFSGKGAAPMGGAAPAGGFSIPPMGPGVAGLFSDANAKTGVVPILSDIRSKVGGGPSGGVLDVGSSGMLPGWGLDRGGSGGMNVKQAAEEHNQAALAYQNQAGAGGGGPATGRQYVSDANAKTSIVPILSDVRSKVGGVLSDTTSKDARIADPRFAALARAGVAKDGSIGASLPLGSVDVNGRTYEPRFSDSGRAYAEDVTLGDAADEGGGTPGAGPRKASLESKPRAPAGEAPKPKPKPKKREKSLDEMAAELQRDVDKRLAEPDRPPAVQAALDRSTDPFTAQLADGLAPSEYSYKPGFGEDPNDRHVGPMAQSMAANPATSVAVMQDPETGLLALEGKKLAKLTAGGVGHLAKKQAETDRKLAGLMRGAR